ncbi:MAG: hypothetical protein HY898_15365 [Deltaproteobacteria bacterium]|nr:hypothetical protein [Deltaproteobacteria bacterium]
MVRVSVKEQYGRIYDGEQFEGELKSHPLLHHGAWICEVFLAEDRVAVAFRLGHLEALESDGINLLDKARAAGWSGQVANDAQQVALWTARDRVWDMIHIAGQPLVQRPGSMSSEEPGVGEWEALEDNLGRQPNTTEKGLFETEFQRVLRDPSATNEWPEG